MRNPIQEVERLRAENEKLKKENEELAAKVAAYGLPEENRKQLVEAVYMVIRCVETESAIPQNLLSNLRIHLSNLRIQRGLL